MPSEAQISDQVSGQATGQMGGQLSDLAQQNGSSLGPQTSNHGGIQRSWHTDIDVHGLRRYVTEKILQTFQQCTITSEWQGRLPNFVNRLEKNTWTWIPYNSACILW